MVGIALGREDGTHHSGGVGESRRVLRRILSGLCVRRKDGDP